MENNMEDKFYWKTEEKKSVVAFSPLQIKKGLNVGLTALTDEEINQFLNPPLSEAEIKENKLNEAKQYFQDTGWIWEKYNRNALVLKDTTSEEFAIKYADIIAKQEEYRLLISELES
jgi:hypothetical protein